MYIFCLFLAHIILVASKESILREEIGLFVYDTLDESQIGRAYCSLVWQAAVERVIRDALISSPYTTGVKLTRCCNERLRREKRFIDVFVIPSLEVTASASEKRLAIEKAIHETLGQSEESVNVIGYEFGFVDNVPSWQAEIPWKQGSFIRLHVSDESPSSYQDNHHFF